MSKGRTTWGAWQYDVRDRILTHKPTAYEVRLDECRTSAQVLDWIAQLAGKGWLSSVDLGNLVRALDSLLHLQGHYCGCGLDRGEVDVRAVLRRVG